MVSPHREILDARIMKSDIPKLYKQIAPVYDLWARFSESKARKRCLELADIRDGESVLEVAVGTGLAYLEKIFRSACEPKFKSLHCRSPL